MRYLFRAPDFKVELSAADARFRGLFSRRLLVFRNSELDKPGVKDEVVDVLRKAFQLLVEKIPPLGGRVRQLDDDECTDRRICPTGQLHWKEVVRGVGLSLEIKDGKAVIPPFDVLEAANFPTEGLPDAELVPIPIADTPKPYEVAKFQLTWIDGGFILACCVSHTISDGTALTEVLRWLAHYVHAVQEVGQKHGAEPDAWKAISTSPQLGLDRSAMTWLKNAPGTPAPEPDGSRQFLVRKKPGEEMKRPPPDSSWCNKIYRISAANSARLKRDVEAALKRSGNSPVDWISTNDCVTALTWRAMAINRAAAGKYAAADEHGASTPLCLVTPATASGRVASVPKGFIGNSLITRGLDGLTHADLAGEPTAAHHPLAKPAAAIRRTVNGAVHYRFAQASEEILQVSEVDELIPDNLASIQSTTLLLASLYSSKSIYESDWGALFGGHVVRLRSTNLGFMNPGCFVFPKWHDGSCEILFYLSKAGIAAMEEDKLFATYVDDYQTLPPEYADLVKEDKEKADLSF